MLFICLLLLFSRPVMSDSLQPMDCSMSGLPVPHHLPKFAQFDVHCIGDAIHPFHPLMPSSPSPLNLSQHQGLFQWVTSSPQVATILELQLQCQFFQWVFRLTGLISLLSKGLSGVFSNTTVWRHLFFSALPSLQSSSHNHSWPLGRP